MTTDFFKNLSLVGWTDPSLSVQHIWILKNASSLIQHNAEQLHWQLKSIPLDKKISRFAILRDPYRRWLVGLVQDIKMLINSRDNDSEKRKILELFESDFNWFLEFLIDRDILFFDTHAHLQVKSLELPLQVLDKEKITFFQMNDKLGYSLNHWLHEKGVPNKFNNAKINATDEKNDAIFNGVNNFFNDQKNINRKNKVLEYLQPDYDFLNSVNFVNHN
jgi:hypothetical protein